MQSQRKCVVAGAIIAGILGVSSANAAMFVDSDPLVTQYSVFSETDGGRSLIQEFTLETTVIISSITFYGFAADAEFALMRDISSTSRQEDEIWRTAFSNTQEGWHDLGGPATLGPGTYFLLMESNSTEYTDASWFRAESLSRVGLGGFSVGLSGPNLYAPATVKNTFTFGAMALRVEGVEVPTPGALALAGIASMVCLRRRRSGV